MLGLRSTSGAALLAEVPVAEEDSVTEGAVWYESEVSDVCEE